MRVLALIEGKTVTGPIKNLFEFHRWCKAEQAVGNEFVPKITLATYARSEDDLQSDFAVEAANAGIELHFLREQRRFDLRVLREIRAIVERCRPDIIQSHNVKSHFLLRLSKCPRHYPWVAFHHGYTTTDRKMRFYNSLDQWSLRGAARILTVCGAFADKVAQYGVPRERIRILHNSVRPATRVSAERIERMRADLGIGQDTLVLLSVGRLSAEKGHRYLFSAFRNVVDQFGKGVSLVIAGEGPELDSLVRMVRSLQLQQFVHFIGHMPDMATAYSAAHVVVIPSLSEGSPNVLLEAMAMSLPVVTTDVGGIPEIAQNGQNALLVPAKNPALLSDAIMRLLGDAKLREDIGKRALERALLFTPESRCRALSSVYREVLAERGMFVGAAKTSNISSSVSST